MLKTKKILILGVTASGKGALGYELAQTLNGQIISVDSMKVYRRMDIGTAKPPAEKQASIPYHLVDVVEPSEPFSVDQFLELTATAVESIHNANKPAIAVGGTAMYIKALLYGLFEGPASDPVVRQQLIAQAEQVGLGQLHRQLAAVDPEAAERIHPNDQRRIVRALEVYQLTGKPISTFQKQWEKPTPTNWLIIGLRREKEKENHRINIRVKRMMDQGLLNEIQSLLDEPKHLSKQAAAAIGYAEIIDHLQGGMSLEEAVEKIKINTRHLAKAQRTWFKTFRQVNWIDIIEDDTLETITPKALDLIGKQ